MFVRLFPFSTAPAPFLSTRMTRHVRGSQFNRLDKLKVSKIRSRMKPPMAPEKSIFPTRWMMMDDQPPPAQHPVFFFTAALSARHRSGHPRVAQQGGTPSPSRDQVSPATAGRLLMTSKVSSRPQKRRKYQFLVRIFFQIFHQKNMGDSKESRQNEY